MAALDAGALGGRSVVDVVSDRRALHRFVASKTAGLSPGLRDEIADELVIEVLGRVARQPAVAELSPPAVLTLALREARRTVAKRWGRDRRVAEALAAGHVEAAPVERPGPWRAATDDPERGGAPPTKGLRPGLAADRADRVCAHCGGAFRPRRRTARYCQREECARVRRNAQWCAAARRRRRRQ